MDTKGGRFSLEIGGAVYSGRAKATIMPARATPDTGVNQDGTGYATVTPQLAEIELSFDRGFFRWTESMLLQPVNITFAEDDVGLTHFLTAGNWAGRPSIDSATGEVTGMKVSSDRYKSVRR